MTPKIDHIDLTVTDLRQAEAFYDKLLPLLAFDAGSREAVDALYEKVSAIPARIVHPPPVLSRVLRGLLRLLFKDTEGIELEIVHFDREGYFPK